MRLSIVLSIVAASWSEHHTHWQSSQENGEFNHGEFDVYSIAPVNLLDISSTFPCVENPRHWWQDWSVSLYVPAPSSHVPGLLSEFEHEDRTCVQCVCLLLQVQINDTVI